MKTIKQMPDMLGNRIRKGDHIVIAGNPYKPMKPELQVLVVDHFEEREATNGKTNVFVYTEEYSGVGFPSHNIVKVVMPKKKETVIPEEKY